MSKRSGDGVAYVLWTTDDFPGYSKFSGPEQAEIQQALGKVRKEADRRSGITRPADGRQVGGDGESVCWGDLEPVTYLADYVPALSRALAEANAVRGGMPRLRLRLAVSHGLAQSSAEGAAGQPPIEAERLISSRQCKRVIKKLATDDLVVIIGEHVFQDAVAPRWRGLKPGDYVPVRVRDKHGKPWEARITVPGAGAERVRAALRRRSAAVAACLAATAAFFLIGAVLWAPAAKDPFRAWSHPGPDRSSLSPTPGPSLSLTPTPTPTPGSPSPPDPTPGPPLPPSPEPTHSGSTPPDTHSAVPNPPPASATSSHAPAGSAYRKGMIKNAGDGQVMDLRGGNATTGTPVTVHPAGDGRSQLWSIKTQNYGVVITDLVSQANPNVMAMPDNNNTVSLASTQYAGPSLGWVAYPVAGSPDAEYLKDNQGNCLTDNGESFQLSLAPCVAGSASQEWIVVQ